MKFSGRFEKYTFLGILLVLFVLIVNSVAQLNAEGGLRAAVVEAGKELKDIAREIKEY